jgi:hypothetical protein
MSIDLSQFGATPAGFRIPGPIGDLITQKAQQYGVDPDLANAVAHQESGGNPHARSPKGAIGVMQLMPHTAQGLGVDPTDPEQNIDGGIRFLKQLHDKYKGDVDKTLAAYNAGPGAVDTHGGVPPYKETQNYVQSIKANLPQTAPQQAQDSSIDLSEFGASPDLSEFGGTLEQQKQEPTVQQPQQENKPAAPAQDDTTTPKFLEHPWDYVNTPIYDLIKGKKGATRDAIESFMGADPVQFKKDHPYLNVGADLASSMSSPLSVGLIAGGPITEAIEGVPLLSKAVPAINATRRLANAGVGVEGAYHAAKGGLDIAEHGLNTQNALETGLGTIQGVLGGAGAMTDFRAPNAEEMTNSLAAATSPRPGVARNFLEDTPKALPYLRDAIEEGGTPKSLKELSGVLENAKSKAAADYQTYFSPMKDTVVDTAPIADRIESRISPYIEQRYPEIADQIRSQAAEYRANPNAAEPQGKSLFELDQIRKGLNGELTNFYKKNRLTQADALRDPEMASKVEEANAIRDLLYENLDPAAREANKSWGTLHMIQNAADTNADRLALASAKETGSGSNMIKDLLLTTVNPFHGGPLGSLYKVGKFGLGLLKGNSAKARTAVANTALRGLSRSIPSAISNNLLSDALKAGSNASLRRK